ncbi:sporulation protein YabP [Proteiniborus ethanoligenes]|uniref:Sporulation protein YabP n=1 Tax=Proteiniborus ethanoligenes TaxID=415015 RepID=A0A1H3KZ96_9FIRM|nr:sporulation protein YabP [Proteiniborus ethanoligenes]SDY57309.1 sporulation protein YabP [Proteiniborus ethanoligenes]
MVTEKKTTLKSNNIILEDREKLGISGVEYVESFNDNTIILFTSKGGLTIKGASLNISKLNLDDGNVTIQGIINSLNYTNKELSANKGGGLLGKMFK